MDYINEAENKAKWLEINKEYYEYEKRRAELTYKWELGKIIDEAEKKEDKVIKKLSNKLSKYYDYSYGYSYLFYYRKYYQISAKPVNNYPFFSWHHMRRIIAIPSLELRNYYIYLTTKAGLTTKKLIKEIQSSKGGQEKCDLVLNNSYQDNTIMVLTQKLKLILPKQEIKILAHLKSFLSSLKNVFIVTDNFSINSEIGSRNIDFLLFSLKYNCYIAVLLRCFSYQKKDEDYLITAMKTIDKKVKEVFHNKTLGLLINREKDVFIIKYFGKENFTIKPYEIYFINI